MACSSTPSDRRRLLGGLTWLAAWSLTGCAGAPLARPVADDRLPAWLAGARLRFLPVEESNPPFQERPGERMGARLTIQGLLERGAATAKPGPTVPMLVAVAARPKSAVDWSLPAGTRWVRQWDNQRGVIFGASDYLLVECELRPDGSFRGSFPARLIGRSLGTAAEHRVALAAPLEGGGAEVYRSTETGLLLPGAPRTSLTQSRITAVVAPGQGVHNPLALVRAVNHLRGLGREGALAALEDYLARLGEEEVWPPRDPDPTSVETGSPGAVFPMVQLLFEPLSARPAAPAYSLGTLEARPRPPLANWPGYPLFSAGDWPFLMGDFAVLRSAPDSDARRNLAWAREHGRLRPLPIVPSAAPLSVLEELEQRSGLPGGNRPRLQVYRALSELLALPPIESASESTDEALLALLQERLNGRRLRWDTGAQTLRGD